jgi:hypothetical protein
MLIYHPQVRAERILVVISDPLATSFPHLALLSSIATDIQTPTIPEEDEATRTRSSDTRAQKIT